MSMMKLLMIMPCLKITKKMLNQVKAAKFASTNMKTAIAQLKKKQKKKGVMGMGRF